VWQGRRRLRRLENAVAEAREERAELQRRVDVFEKIAEAAGASLRDPANHPAPIDPVPSALLAAAWDRDETGVPVRVDVDGREVIAVIGEGGDPREWWTAIRRLASRLRSAS
jgi:hypothetical protein